MKCENNKNELVCAMRPKQVHDTIAHNITITIISAPSQNS